MSVPHPARGRFALLALLLALVAPALTDNAAAEAATSPKASTVRAAERRAAKVCAQAARTKSARTTKTCKTLKARLAAAARKTKRAPAKPAPPVVVTVDPTPVANVPAAPATGTTAPTPAPTPVPTSPAMPADAQAATAPATVSRLYSASSPFNTRVSATPRLAGNSAAMVAKSLLPYVNTANFANSDDWGISIVSAKAGDPLRSISVFDWGYGADIAQPAVRIPDGAKPTLGSDHHLVVLDGDREMDMWVGEQQGDGSWKAGARAATSASGDGIAGPVSGNAAGFALAAGVVRPEEIRAGRIEHALVFTSPYIRNGFVAPAVHGDGRQSDPDAMPMGTRIQLNPAADISGLPKAQRIAAQALKDYGAFLVDSSGSLAIRGEAGIGRASTGGPADIWSPVGVTDASMKAIPWSQMRVIAP